MTGQQTADGAGNRENRINRPSRNHTETLPHVKHRHIGEKGLTDDGPQEHDQPNQGNDLPGIPQAFLKRSQETLVLHPFALWRGNYPQEIDQNEETGDHGRRHGRQAKIGHIPGNKQGPKAEGQGASGIEYRHGKASLAASIQGYHTGNRRMEHGGADRTKSHTKEQHPKIGGDSGKRYKNNGQRQADENKGPRLESISKISDGRLDNKGKESHGTGNNTYLGQAQTKFTDKYREQRGDEGTVEIAGKMDEGQSEEYFQISGHVADSHRLSRSLAMLPCVFIFFVGVRPNRAATGFIHFCIFVKLDKQVAHGERDFF